MRNAHPRIKKQQSRTNPGVRWSEPPTRRPQRHRRAHPAAGIFKNGETMHQIPKIGLAALAFTVLGSAAAADTSRVIVAFKPGAAASAKAALSAARASIKVELPQLNA